MCTVLLPPGDNPIAVKKYISNPGNFEFKYNGLFKCLSIWCTQFLLKIADSVIILVEILDTES